MRLFVKISGLVLLLISLILAFVFHYNHFYELTLIGLFLFLHASIKENIFPKRLFILVYGLYIIFGLVLDLLSQYFGLWHYSYTYLWEYLPLYLLIYPLGGIVMYQSYVFVAQLFHVSINVRGFNAKKIVSISTIISISTLLLFILLPVDRFTKIGLILIFSSMAITLCLADYLSGKWGGRSYWILLSSNLISIGAITLISTYVNAFIHEYPNTYSQQWVYTVKTNTFLDTQILNISLIVLLGWLTLTVGPVIMYNLIESIDKKIR